VTEPTVISLGCRLNRAESEAIKAINNGRNIVVVNTCAVTTNAVNESRSAIRRARRDHPTAELIVTGCAAQIDPDSFAAMPEVDRIIGNAEKLSATAWSSTAPVVMQDIMAVQRTADYPVAQLSSHARAFVEVQNGCDHRCTFCIIPFGRGNSRSVPADNVVARISEIIEQGHLEIVLTGVDLTSYGSDLPGAPSLASLVERLLREVPNLARLRLSSLDSIEIDDHLLNLIMWEDRLMPHLHLSLQAGDDMILKRMKRRHSRRDAIRIVERIKAARPETAIGADLIAGFPTETDAMFANTLALLDDCDIVHAHIFPYSPRAGTPAARMPPVDPAIRKRRAAILRTAALNRRNAWLSTMIGTTQSVLVERPGTGGHAPNFADVRWEGSAAIGSIQPVQITGVDAGMLTGVIP